MTSVLTCVHITKAAINIGINNSKNGEIFDKSVFIFLGVKVFIFFLNYYDTNKRVFSFLIKFFRLTLYISRQTGDSLHRLY
jgi:hypothetical protein